VLLGVPSDTYYTCTTAVDGDWGAEILILASVKTLHRVMSCKVAWRVNLGEHV